jgi:hypothetical protein
VRLFFHRREHPRKRAHLVGRKSPGDRALERFEMTMDAGGDLPAARRGLDEERPAIRRSDVPGDEAAPGEAIENAGQRRSFVRKAPVQARDGRRAGRREVGEDVRFALRQAELTDVREIQADPVCRSMNRWNEAQRHRR